MYTHARTRDTRSIVNGREWFMVFSSGWFLCATPGILLWDDELQDQLGCPTRFLHHHRVPAALQYVHFASRQHICNDRSTGDIHHLDKQQTIIKGVSACDSCFDGQVRKPEWQLLIQVTWISIAESLLEGRCTLPDPVCPISLAKVQWSDASALVKHTSISH